MKIPFADHFTFFREFRTRFETTGAIAPSSRFLAGAMTKPYEGCRQQCRVLEIGPGTGAVTQRLVKVLKKDDRLDLVELNENFASLLQQRFDTDKHYRKVAAQSAVHVCALQDFKPETQYDYIISGLPLNNFPVDLVRDIFRCYFELLAPGGILSYFEYMYVRPIRRLVSKPDEKQRLSALEEIMSNYLVRHRFHRNWVFVNFPPAWVQHLRNEDLEAPQHQHGEHPQPV